MLQSETLNLMLTPQVCSNTNLHEETHYRPTINFCIFVNCNQGQDLQHFMQDRVFAESYIGLVRW